jgi:hypothetical protein
LISPNPDGVFAVTAFGVVMARFLLAVLIGVGLTLAWQSYGEETKQIVGPWARDTITSHAPSLVWLLPSWTEPRPQVDVAAKETRSAPSGDVTNAEVAKTSEVLMQRLEAIARDLAMIRGSTEQLATKQQEMAQSIATLQANIEQKLASPPGPPAIATPPNENTARPPPPAARRALPSR